VVVSPAGLAPDPRPFVVAHRAGNDLRLLARAARAGVRLVEADVHLFAGRLEVRHLKTLGPVPVLWDRWELRPPWTPRLSLHRLLAAVGPDTELMLDLKGRDVRLAVAVADAVRRIRPERPLTVCSQCWALVEAVRDAAAVRVVHSVGGARQLARLRARLEREPVQGISIHRRLLTPAVTGELRARAGVLMTWPVSSAADARELAAWGVDGVITEQFDRLVPLLAAAPPEARAA
jgi:glycerophosphoryl diester phosphodiesterase